MKRKIVRKQYFYNDYKIINTLKEPHFKYIIDKLVADRMSLIRLKEFNKQVNEIMNPQRITSNLIQFQSDLQNALEEQKRIEDTFGKETVLEINNIIRNFRNSISIDLIEYQRQVKEFLNIKFLANLKNLEPDLRDFCIENDSFSEKFANENFWCLDDEIRKYHIEYKGNELDEEFIVTYIEEHLESYEKSILNAPMFATQKDILEESFAVSKIGYYRIAIFPLIATFDNVVTRWSSKILNEKYSYEKIKMRAYQVKEKLSDIKKHRFETVDPKEMNENLNIIKLKAISILYFKLFDNKPANKNNLNRNSIMHGSFKYNRLDKVSYYKIISLLHVSMCLAEIEPTAISIRIKEN